MMATLSVTILGCGSSGGVPRLGGKWGACDPADPRNARRRCSILVTRSDAGGATRVLVDTSPDLRAQLLDAGVGELDAVIYTHDHADHTHGIDDLRMVVYNTHRKLQVWADTATSDSLLHRFGYAFVQPKGSEYPPILDLNLLDGGFSVGGAGGEIAVTPLPVGHGNATALGFRFGPLAYIPDVSDIPEPTWALLSGLDLWIVDALRYKPHPSHSHLDKTLAWIDRAAPRQAILTNMHVDLDYATLAAETPAHVTPGHDGLTVSFDV
jgi:phosphoribosyl 1,2-cyclic phosphate phosphodiesterase